MNWLGSLMPSARLFESSPGMPNTANDSSIKSNQTNENDLDHILSERSNNIDFTRKKMIEARQVAQMTCQQFSNMRHDLNNSSTNTANIGYIDLLYNQSQACVLATKNYRFLIDRLYDESLQEMKQEKQENENAIKGWDIGDGKLPYQSLKNIVDQNLDADTYFKLGKMCLNGDGVDQNDYEAFDCCKKAAELGQKEAQSVLASMYRIGRGVSPNAQQAFIWYQKSAHLGSPEARYITAMMCHNGEGVSSNYELACQWLQLLHSSELQQKNRYHTDATKTLNDWARQQNSEKAKYAKKALEHQLSSPPKDAQKIADTPSWWSWTLSWMRFSS